MSIFGKVFKKKEVLEQNLEEKARPGAVFVMQLLFEEPCDMPEREQMNSVMEKHLGEIDNFSYDEKMAGFAVKKYLAEFKDAKVPPQLMITACNEFDASKIGVMERSQMWDCAESEQILDSCKYQVFATDMMAAALHYKERAELDMDFLEALIELYPTCKAVYFNNSGKLFTAEMVREHKIPRESRFIYFAVNVRFFNIQGTEDMLVDSLGMNTLFLPDLQYHFHGMNQNWVVNHAYNVLSYIFDNENPIKSGDPIDGVVDGRMSREVMWRCQYENSLIQPVREVIDIYMNEYASGGR
ncbi:MAG: DUF4261 domain-containing protein [Lachnospiraceae bacterium]|nr:DUF4261 domain-containing protein [Lachnospiraceae bacterium]